MQIEREDLNQAVSRQIIAVEQAHALWKHFEERHPARARFNGLNVAYYFGALVVISGMGWLITLGFERLGPWAVFVIALAYATGFVFAGSRLWPQMPIPGGLLYTMAVCMTPLAIWALENATGMWPRTPAEHYRDFYPYIRDSWIWMEGGTVIAALVALRKVRFSFLVAPAAVALWFMSMDLAAYLATGGHWEVDLARRVSIGFGLGLILVAYLIDRNSREDFGFWLYLFGITALWGALTSMHSDSQLRRFLYCLLNLAFISGGALLRRRVFVIYGAIGVNLYLGQLAYDVFKDSVLFPFALTLLGLSVIAAAVKYQRNRMAIDGWVQSLVPEAVRDLLPRQYL